MEATNRQFSLNAVGGTTILLLLLLSPLGQTGKAQQWQDYFLLQGDGLGSIQFLEPLQNDQVFLAGIYDDVFTGGGETLASYGETDIFFGIWDDQGQNNWIQSIGGGDDNLLGTALVRNNNEFLLAASFFDEIQVGATNITSSISSGAFLLACTDEQGLLCWSNTFESNGSRWISDMVETSTGEIIVAGYFSNDLYIDQTLVLSTGEIVSHFIAHFSTNGDFIQAYQVENANTSIEVQLAISDNDALFLAGGFNNQIIIGTNTLVAETHDLDIYISKINLTDFSPDWAVQLGAQYDDHLANIIWSEDQLLIGGYFFGVLNFKTGGLAEITTPGFNNNGFLGVLSDNGSPISITGFGGQADEMVTDVGIRNGKAIWAGHYLGDPNFYGANLPETPDFTIYGFAGTWSGEQWSWALPLTSDNQAFFNHIRADETDRVWVAGNFKGNTSFDGTQESAGNGTDAFFGLLSPLFTPTLQRFEGSLKVYPNPTNDFIFLESNCQIDRIEIYDGQGRKHKVYLNQNQINLTNLVAGIYFLQMSDCNGIQLKKIVKH